MRHGKKFNHLGRTTSHRRAMLSNMATSLIVNKRITTTVAKAKALRKYVEPLVTRSKSDTTHSRRIVFSYLQDKDAVTTLFGEVAEKIASRPGGYTRIIRTGRRLGDAAETCLIELVDFNELYVKESKSTGAKKSRRRSSSKKASGPVEGESQVDDLKKVEGIGPKIAEALNAAGITTFVELASKTPEDIKTILQEAGGSLKSKNPGSWPKQSQMAADGNWDELKKWQDEHDNGIEK